MWRQAGKVSYLRHSHEMANILRQCCASPYREKMLDASATHMLKTDWTKGVPGPKQTIEKVEDAFN